MSRGPKYKYKLAHPRAGAPQGGIQIGRNMPITRSIARQGYTPASPGIDGDHNFGTAVSGASTGGTGAVQSVSRVAPSDWSSQNDVWGHKVGGGLMSIFSRAKDANQIRNRARGVSPWGGFSGTTVAESGSGVKSDSVMKPGGTMDHNSGADSQIAGGKMGHMQASTLVRIHGGRHDANMRLPVLPQAAKRSGKRVVMAGGGADAGIAAPVIPTVPGLPSIFNVGGTDNAAAGQPPANGGCGQ